MGPVLLLLLGIFIGLLIGFFVATLVYRSQARSMGMGETFLCARGSDIEMNIGAGDQRGSAQVKMSGTVYLNDVPQPIKAPTEDPDGVLAYQQSYVSGISVTDTPMGGQDTHLVSKKSMVMRAPPSASFPRRDSKRNSAIREDTEKRMALEVAAQSEVFQQASFVQPVNSAFLSGSRGSAVPSASVQELACAQSQEKNDLHSSVSGKNRSSVASIPSKPDEPQQEEVVEKDRSRNRIQTGVDVLKDLDTWWGVGPCTPDMRLEAQMPGHILSTEVEDVQVQRSSDIEQLWNSMPQDDLCIAGEKYVLFQMKLGKVCMLSLHQVVDSQAYEKILSADGGNILKDKLKLIVNPVNLAVSVPVKGPKDAATMGSFFGLKNTTFRRSAGKYDVAMITVDLYSVWSLSLLLPKVAFTAGRMVDFHLLSYKDNAVLASYRAAMTPQVIDAIKRLGG